MSDSNETGMWTCVTCGEDWDGDATEVCVNRLCEDRGRRVPVGEFDPPDETEAEIDSLRAQLAEVKIVRDGWFDTAHQWRRLNTEAAERGVCELIADGIITSSRGREILGLEYADDMRKVTLKHRDVFEGRENIADFNQRQSDRLARYNREERPDDE